MLNSKFEYRNTKQYFNDQNKGSFGNLNIGILNLFRISCFVLAFCAFAYASSLDTAGLYFLKDDYEGAIKECREIIKTNPKGDKAAQAYYILGLSYLKLNDALQARESLEAALNTNPAPPLKEKVELALAESYFLNGEIETAREKFSKILSDYPRSSFIPTVYFHLGHCALKSGMWDETRSYFDRIGREYPLSLEAPVAQDVLRNGEFYFTIQIGSFINQKNAEELCQNLKNKGYDAYLTEFKSSSATYHRVRVGKYDLKSVALNEEEKLKSDGFPTHLWP